MCAFCQFFQIQSRFILSVSPLATLLSKCLLHPRSYLRLWEWRLQKFLLPCCYILRENPVFLIPVWQKCKHFRSESLCFLVDSIRMVDILETLFIVHACLKYLRFFLTQYPVTKIFPSDNVLFWIMIGECRDLTPESTMPKQEDSESIGQLEA